MTLKTHLSFQWKSAADWQIEYLILMRSEQWRTVTEGDDVHHVLDMSKTSFSPEDNPSLCPTSHPAVSFLPDPSFQEVYFITSKNKMLDHFFTYNAVLLLIISWNKMMIIMCEHNAVLQMTINRLERYTALGAGVFTVTQVVLDLVRSLQ